MRNRIGSLAARAVVGLASAILFGCGHQTDDPAPVGLAVEAATRETPPARRPARQENAMLPGRWMTADSHSLTPEQLDEIARLEAIGYASGSRDWAGPTGVTVHRAGRTFDGLNFYSSGHGTEALLIDMQGQVLHRWSRSWEEIFPDVELDSRDLDKWYWRRVFLLEDGSIVGIFEGRGIFRLDVDSNVIWANPIHAHHDAAFTSDGDLYTLTRRAVIIPAIHPTEPILEDFVTRLDGSNGEVQESFSLARALARSKYAKLWREREFETGDVMHVNAVEILDGRLGHGKPPFDAGRLLLSSAYMHLVFVVDPVARQVVWARRGSWQGQHDPGSLDNGSFLLFDNGVGRMQSRILEVEPSSGREEVVYAGTEESPFWSRFCGAVVRLPNGNTMISETDTGRAFEIADDGQIVWEYYNPERAGENGEFIAAIPEMVRIPEAYTSSWLDRRTAGRE